MKILVRLPNWLGDMVMAAGLMNSLHEFYPGAEISVIAKKGIHELLSFFPNIKHQFVFDKTNHKGLIGAWQFGKEIKKAEKFDLFICLPDSLSAAVMAFATGTEKRIGYKKELRSLFLTDTYTKEKGQHRVKDYITLIEKFSGKKSTSSKVQLIHNFKKENYIVVNINSEASSRRLTLNKATEIINNLRSSLIEPIILIGAPKEKGFVDEVYNNLAVKNSIQNKSGKTNLAQLAELMASASLVLSTDSGPAHLANALGTQTIILFGAGNEFNTAPYNENRNIIRLGELSCEPCQKNKCVRYEIPQCLEQLSTKNICTTVVTELHKIGAYE
ncbi:MAG TPA: glycosyltransferase family 9 protein [Chitinophagaceae bacterium]|nr:glycosyltransferase family 9 protein [Chitinophagaceae bacterium]